MLTPPEGKSNDVAATLKLLSTKASTTPPVTDDDREELSEAEEVENEEQQEDTIPEEETEDSENEEPESSEETEETDEDDEDENFKEELATLKKALKQSEARVAALEQAKVESPVEEEKVIPKMFPTLA